MTLHQRTVSPKYLLSIFYLAIYWKEMNSYIKGRGLQNMRVIRLQQTVLLRADNGGRM